MNTLIVGLTDFTLICLISIFFILVTTIYKVFQDVSFFNNKAASVLVSVCVALLSIIGMITLFTPGDGINAASDNSVNRSNDGLDFLLLPYIALGIVIIVALLLKFLFDTYEKYGLRRFNKKCHQDVEKRHASERNTVVWKNDDEESRIRR